jgi:4'-phosphopantetheinyl transferase
LSWSSLPSAVPLGPADVQVWRVSLAAGGGVLARLRAVLTDDERARADRFVNERHGARFTVAHAFLRDVLSRHVGAPAGSLRFDTASAGKPFLAGSRLRFNLSHSGDVALLAVGLDREIGVDVEGSRPLSDALELAERYFAPVEVAALRSLPAPEREDAFLRCWTLKEAYVKGVGGGLGIPLDGFEVQFAPAREEPGLRILGATGRPAWTLRTLEPGPGYFGALAVHGSGWRLACFDWSP